MMLIIANLAFEFQNLNSQGGKDRRFRGSKSPLVKGERIDQSASRYLEESKAREDGNSSANLFLSSSFAPLIGGSEQTNRVKFDFHSPPPSSNRQTGKEVPRYLLSCRGETQPQSKDSKPTQIWACFRRDSLEMTLQTGFLARIGCGETSREYLNAGLEAKKAGIEVP